MNALKEACVLSSISPFTTTTPLPFLIAVLLKARHHHHPTAHCPCTGVHYPLLSYLAFDPHTFSGSLWIGESSLKTVQTRSVCNPGDLLQHAVSYRCQHRANWVEMQSAKSRNFMVPCVLNSVRLDWGDGRSTTYDLHKNGILSKLTSRNNFLGRVSRCLHAKQNSFHSYEKYLKIHCMPIFWVISLFK